LAQDFHAGKVLDIQLPEFLDPSYGRNFSLFCGSVCRLLQFFVEILLTEKPIFHAEKITTCFCIEGTNNFVMRDMIAADEEQFI
jgi:hypothetical protein